MTEVSLYAVFDGHGGELAADFAKQQLMTDLGDKVQAVKDYLAGKRSDEPLHQPSSMSQQTNNQPNLVQRKKSFTSDDTVKKVITDSQILNKLAASRTITRQVAANEVTNQNAPSGPLSSYADGGKLDYNKLLSDQVLAADALLLQKAKKTMDVAGTTALIAVIDGDRLVVANVGDSRGVMCDFKGNAIPLSFDHKPQQMREQKRIKEAGGFIAFNGVWRVAGILATSRALGDYPLKDKKFVVADPDVLSFNLADHKPSFIILATDGLWDTFSNEEAVDFIKDKLDDPLYGAEDLVMQAYKKGSVDNITVLIVDLRDRKYSTTKESSES